MQVLHWPPLWEQTTVKRSLTLLRRRVSRRLHNIAFHSLYSRLGRARRSCRVCATADAAAKRIRRLGRKSRCPVDVKTLFARPVQNSAGLHLLRRPPIEHQDPLCRPETYEEERRCGGGPRFSGRRFNKFNREHRRRDRSTGKLSSSPSKRFPEWPLPSLDRP
jgi:hypothetical protein